MQLPREFFLPIVPLGFLDATRFSVSVRGNLDFIQKSSSPGKKNSLNILSHSEFHSDLLSFDWFTADLSLFDLQWFIFLDIQNVLKMQSMITKYVIRTGW